MCKGGAAFDFSFFNCEKMELRRRAKTLGVQTPQPSILAEKKGSAYTLAGVTGRSKREEDVARLPGENLSLLLSVEGDLCGAGIKQETVKP